MEVNSKMQAQATGTEAVLQSQVEDLTRILPLDKLRLGEDAVLFEDEDGTLYVVAQGEVTMTGPAEDATVARIVAGNSLQVEQVEADQLQDRDLRRINGTGFVE